MVNIYNNLKLQEKNNKSLIYFIILSVLGLVSFYFFLNLNLNYLFKFDVYYYLLLLSLFAIFNFIFVLLSILYDLERIIFFNILLIFITYFTLNSIFQNNQIIFLSLLGILFLGNLFIYYSLENIYKKNINIDWLHLFRNSWNIFCFFYLMFTFTILTFLPSLERLSFQDIYKNLDKFSNFNNFYLNKNIVEILNKNIDQNLPDKIKKEAIQKAIQDLNNKFNLNLTPQSSVKEAIAQYLTNQIDLLKKNKDKNYVLKSIIFFVILIIIQPIFYFLGFIVSTISKIFIDIIIYFKIFKISYNQVLKETIEI
ncbi:MAG: hypothetical protein NZ866_01380 [Patescibacteria group bacterium]|nr:hypothetical protein [Patescibacteria group bacterium]